MLTGWLQGETAFCDLLGLTLAGVLAGCALVFQSAKARNMPSDVGLAILAAPTLFLSVVIFFPSPERLMLYAPAVPLATAVALRAYLGWRSGG